ncbi:eCIS core domain-containing protein [Umezakia ovalisporum]|uniref:DUF4157 domain-containing protein n=1 Tax=Umezakia ovalisporum FSS-43 TaxID=2740520 RepID=A0ABT6K192_9CYAN|nr:DUF4157 domain-containing protein [Umezakia ovalisporum]MDH6056117.1 DUF4157 domain-containing protein [Umezakia ovalisporum FSS-43]MDH6067004.1 DUF4157 domain-containing protein [Umezakia ovalisporum APH033B]MDH6069843.1 DUF4157 domain-containing protein [Umezakia ovalisporum CobakiLakeA]MDH6079078.1 DUF4157 domain-containing protein [Umezakia ovalisporum FSS-45]MDH6081249.1 DUF4157 domain-containing protein [Umezakia ovalisporum FSS-44]
MVQTKLRIHQAGDKYEQEADQVAVQVVKQINQPLSRSDQSELILGENLMRKSASSLGTAMGGMAATSHLETAIKQEQGRGQPISNDIREPLEQSFGSDFSRVRVHTNDQSDKLNRSIQSVAFTTGQNIFFKQGAYQPGSRQGQELLAHELTHVVQQGHQGQVIQRKPPASVKKKDIAQNLLKETSSVTKEGSKIAKAAGSSDPATSTATSAGDIVSGVGNFMEVIRNDEKDTVDKVFAGGKMAAGIVGSSTSITSQWLKSDTQENGIVSAVSEVAGGVSSLWDVFAEAKGLLAEITNDKGISKTKIGKAAANTIANLGKTAKAGAASANKIQTLISAKEQAKISSNASSIIGESVTLFESVAKGIEQIAGFVKDYQEGKFSDENLQSYRITEFIFQSVNSLSTLTTGGIGLGKTIAEIVGNDAAKAALGLGANAMGIVTGSVQVLQSGYKIGRAAVKKDKLDFIAAGRSEEEQKALMLIKDRLTKQQANAGINMVLGAAGIVSGSLAVSGVGALPGAILAGIAAGFKISRVGFQKFKQYMRDKAQSEYDEAVTILTEVSKEVTAKQQDRKANKKGFLVGMEPADYYSGISRRMETAKHSKTKKILESVLEDIRAEKGLLFTEEQITLFMGEREYGKTIDILKQVASQVPPNAKKSLGEDTRAYRKALKAQIETAKGKTKDRLTLVLDYIDKDNPLPLKEIEILKIIEDAEVSRIGQSNIVMRQFIFSRLKSTKQKEAMYYMSAEQILKMDLDEVYTILNLNKSEINQAAEKAKTNAEKKYADEEYKDMSEAEKGSLIQGEVAEEVKKIVIKKLKDIK